MSASHTHALPSTENERALRFALALTGSFLVAEVIGGVLTGSLALISDAAHMLTDAAALAIALAAIRIARRPADRRRTYGYHRFEILAAAFNAMLLFAVALYILVEAYRRFDWDTPILLRLSNNPLRFTACALPWLLASILQGVERTELGLGLAKPNKPGSKRSAVG